MTLKRTLTLTVLITVFVLGFAVSSHAELVELIDIGTCSVSDIDDQTYDSEEQKPGVTVTNEEGEVLTEGEDYTLSYEDNIDCGTATVYITGTGACTGEKTATFNIVKAKPSIAGLGLKYNKNASTSISDKITVRRLYGGKVYLQRYDKASRSWKTARTYTAEGAKDRFGITYTNYWKKHSITRWRIYIPSTENTKSLKSDTVEITAMNTQKLKLSSKSAVIICADSEQILYSKNRDVRRHNASTTKIMTSLLLLENSKDRGTVKISKNAAHTPWRYFNMKPGEKFKAGNLFTAMLVVSSNDSAVALAEHAAGTEKKFVSKMNRRAEELGLENTHFRNPHGLDTKNHYSSAYDISMLTKAAMQYDGYMNRIKKRSFSYKNLAGTKTYKGRNNDTLLGIKGFKGGKTGYTSKAGACFSGIYRYKGRDYIFTTLGAKTPAGRWSDARKLMKYIRDNY